MQDIRDKKIIEDLLKEYKENRESLKRSIKEIDGFKDVIKEIFPKKIDIRNKYILEERIKTSVEFHNVILKYRQELNRMIKDEIEIRRKLDEKEKKDEGEITLEQLKRIEKLINNKEEN